MFLYLVQNNQTSNNNSHNDVFITSINTKQKANL